MMKAIGIDIGGTRIKSVVMNTSGELLQQDYTPTQDGDDRVWKEAVRSIVSKVKAEQGDEELVLGISAPGLPDETNSCIAYMPGRMQGLENFCWKDFLGLPAYVLNDAVSALVAEARFGAAAGKKQVVMITLGTGVGGAILIDGKPYQGAFGKAGHIGHMVIDDDGETDVTGMPGSLEDCIGNCTIQRRSRGRFTSTHSLLEAFRSGDDFAKEIWLKSVRQLAIGLASVTNILSPEVIILGGGITEAGNDLFEPLEQYMAMYEWRAGGHKAAIIRAGYGDMAGAAGAACFAMDKKRI